MAGLHRVGLVLDGQHLALLEPEGSRSALAPAVLGIHTHLWLLRPALVLFRVCIVFVVPAVSGLRRSGEICLLDESPSAFNSSLRT